MASPDFFNDLEPILRRMMASSASEVASAAAYDITGTSFRSKDALALASECAAGNDALRIGAAQLYGKAIRISAARPRSEEALKSFFFDPQKEVREAASACFHHLPEGQLQQFRGLIQVFVSSPSFAEFHSALIQLLDRAKSPSPEIIIEVATAFLDCVGAQAADLCTRTGGDGYVLQSLVFRIRRETSDASVKQECDSAINRMLDIGIYGVKKNLQRLDDDKHS